jgi:hypothetical protein
MATMAHTLLYPANLKEFALYTGWFLSKRRETAKNLTWCGWFVFITHGQMPIRGAAYPSEG